MEVSQILLAAQSGDAATRQAAEQQIEAAKANNLPALMQTMATELANEAAPDPTTRQLAGLVLKNCVQAKSWAAQAALTARWQQLPPELKAQIKTLVTGALASPALPARQTAPQVRPRRFARRACVRAFPRARGLARPLVARPSRRRCSRRLR